MKILFFICMVIVLGSATRAHAGGPFDDDIRRLDRVSRSLPTQENPHFHDAEMPELTLIVERIFHHLFPQEELVSYDAACKSLRTVAATEMGDFPPPDIAPPDNKTWLGLLNERLKYDVHPKLLPPAFYFTQSLDAKRALVRACEPLNPSMSAVYNVWFMGVADYLSRLYKLRHGEVEEEAAGGGGGERAPATITPLPESQFTVAGHAKAARNAGGGLAVEGTDITAHYQLTNRVRVPQGRYTVRGEVLVTKGAAGVGILTEDNQSWVIPPSNHTFNAAQGWKTFEVPVANNTFSYASLVFTNQRQHTELSNFEVKGITITSGEG